MSLITANFGYLPQACKADLETNAKFDYDDVVDVGQTLMFESGTRRGRLSKCGTCPSHHFALGGGSLPCN